MKKTYKLIDAIGNVVASYEFRTDDAAISWAQLKDTRGQLTPKTRLFVGEGAWIWQSKN